MSDDLKARFGNLLAAHRRRAGLTQSALAEAASLSVKMIQSIEKGSSGTSFESVERLAKALEIDPSELFAAGIPDSLCKNPLMAPLIVRLAKASDKDLEWLTGAIDTLLKRKA